MFVIKPKYDGQAIIYDFTDSPFDIVNIKPTAKDVDDKIILEEVSLCLIALCSRTVGTLFAAVGLDEFREIVSIPTQSQILSLFNNLARVIGETRMSKILISYTALDVSGEIALAQANCQTFAPVLIAKPN